MNANDEAALKEGCVFDEAAALRVRRFANKCCRHSKGRWAGEPFDFTPDCWEHFIKPLYGWKRKDGSRRFRQAFDFEPKKNGKSTKCAVLSLFHTTGDGEPAPEVYGAAKNRQQAGIVFNEAKLMVRTSPVLSSLLRIVDTKKTIHYDATGGFYRCLSADAGTQEGLNISALIRDELHALKDRELYEALKYGGAARRQPVIIDITTAGSDKDSICYELYSYAKQVERGEVIDTSFLPYIREAGEEDDFDNPATWAKANPSWGITIDPEVFRQEWAAAKRSGPSAWSSFLRYRLNLWIEDITDWLPVEMWDACNGEPTFPPGADVFGGLDLSSTTDLTSFVLWCPATYSIRVWFWIPREAFKWRERRNKTRIDQYEGTGDLRVMDGARIDHDIIERDVVEICKGYNVKKIGADPYNAVDLLMRLSDNHRHGLPVESYRQGMLHLSPPMKYVEGLILGKAIRHGGHPVLRWNFRNVAVKSDESENKRPVKNKSPDKIDGIVALLMAVGVGMKAGDMTSVYDKGQSI